MVQTLADPQYQETVSNLSPAEQQHMDEQMAGLDTPEAGVAYMRGVVSFKQQHPGVSLTEVDGSFQRPPRSDHPAEQQGGDSSRAATAVTTARRQHELARTRRGTDVSNTSDLHHNNFPRKICLRDCLWLQVCVASGLVGRALRSFRCADLGATKEMGACGRTGGRTGASDSDATAEPTPTQRCGDPCAAHAERNCTEG